ncbi:hypothetical protein KDH_73750 [Dictyobacter sp. S3.2.2.5]|uniref:Response regulatory domain-containing protein n=2 Tax=Dictyobacter halimunensis TaxID=3026934 RepID=A0ABQ6G637_9CHLR|nr:hypothetical protein KDH_73750 [Dictyobacter sp. S3.2.2.5]
MQHILVIDNSREILDLFRDILEAEGYEVSLTESVPTSVRDLDPPHPDLVILDCQFGKQQEARQFVQSMENCRATASIPLILCSTDLQAVDNLEDYVERQHIPVVYKPFDIDELARTVHQTITPRFTSCGP